MANLEEMDNGIVKKKLLQSECDYFQFKFNTPQASHMGGVYRNDR